MPGSLGQVWPVAMIYVAASNGNYRGTLSKGVALLDGKTYTAKVTADGGPGLFGRWDEQVRVKVRR